MAKSVPFADQNINLINLINIYQPYQSSSTLINLLGQPGRCERFASLFYKRCDTGFSIRFNFQEKSARRQRTDIQLPLGRRAG